MSTVNTPNSQMLDVTAAIAPPREVSRTVEYWLHTVIWTALAMIACAVAYCIEKYGFRLKELGLPRMFFNPAEIAMRIFGLPHFIVGLFFMLTARRMRTVNGWLWFAGLLCMGLAFAWVFHRFGAHRSPVMLIAFYFYFLIHGFRDEAFFYKSYGDCPTGTDKPHQRVLLVLQLMLIPLLFAFLMPTYLLIAPSYGQKVSPDDPVLNLVFPASVPFLVKFAWYLLPVLALNTVLYLWLERTYPGRWKAIWREHHPLMVVFLASTGIVLATLFVGPWTFNFVVLAHFVGWYLFALRKLKKIPGEPPGSSRRSGSEDGAVKREQLVRADRGDEPASDRVDQPASDRGDKPTLDRGDKPPGSLFRWLRTTQAGFKTMHLGLAVLVTILIAVSTYALGNNTWLDTLVGGPSFYYWTVLHVSLSFYPR